MTPPAATHDGSISPKLSIEHVIEAIEDAIGVVKGPLPLTPDMPLAELQLDSLDVLEVIMQLEAVYCQDLPGLDLVNGLHVDSTIRDLATVFLEIARPQET